MANLQLARVSYSKRLISGMLYTPATLHHRIIEGLGEGGEGGKGV